MRRIPGADFSAAVDIFLFRLSVYGVPIAIGLASLAALVLLQQQYDLDGATQLPLAILEQTEPNLSQPTALKQLADQPVVPFRSSNLSTSPFWISFSVAASEHSAIVEFPSRHAVEIICWRADDNSQLGFASRVEAVGSMKAAKTGFALYLGRLPGPARVLCRSSYIGPAHISAVLWPEEQFRQSELKFHRNSGLLDGGMITLALFVLLAAFINREWLYVLFAAWLIANLRLAALSGGWDIHWLEHTISPAWLIPMRKLTTAMCYVLTIVMFVRLFSNDLRCMNVALILRGLQWSCLLLILAALALPYSNYLPVLWICVFYMTAVMVFLLLSILIKTRSRVAMWYGSGLIVVLLSTFNEVLAAAMDYRNLIGSVNSVTAALSSSMLAALAIAEQVRHERQGRTKAQNELRSTYETVPIGLFSLDAQGRITQANSAYKKLLGRHATESAHWGGGFEAGAWERLKALADNPSGEDLELKEVASGPGRQRSFLVKATRTKGRIEGSLQDVTERVEAKEKLIRSQARLSNAQRLGSIGSWEWDLTDEKLECSDEMLKIFDLPNKPNIVFQDLLARVHPEDKKLVRGNLVASLRDKVIYPTSYRIVMENGSERFLVTRKEFLFGEDGTSILKMSGTVQDVTQQRKYELDLMRTREQLRTLSAHHEVTLERERKHMASEIHDELGQHLTAVQMGLSALRMGHAENGIEVAKVDDLLSKVSHTMNIVRYVATSLRPAALDLGLLPAIEWLAEDFNHRWEIPCSVEVSGNPAKIDEIRSTAVFRIVQESLTNVSRHAQAGMVTIILHYSDGKLHCKVGDNGMGFDPKLVREKNGFGLLGMRERMLALGGEMHIESELHHGTTISIVIPL